MIGPISTHRTKPPLQTDAFSPSAQVKRNTPSTIRSLGQPRRLVSTVLAFFHGLIDWVRSFFFSPGQAPPDPKPLPPTPNPRTDPSTSSIENAFHKLIFVSEEGDLRNKEGFEHISALFAILGVQSYWGWIPNTRALISIEKKIKDLSLHSLEFFYFCLSSEIQTTRLTNFQKQSKAGAFLLKMKTGRAPWEEFVTKNAQNLSNHEASIPKLLPGFCETLQLDLTKLQSLVEKKDWEAFIINLVYQRKKYFNL